MTVSLNTADPFNGKLYSKEEPTACEAIGRSTTNTLLTMPFSPRSSCGIREDVSHQTITPIVLLLKACTQTQGIYESLYWHLISISIWLYFQFLISFKKLSLPNRMVNTPH